MLKSALQHRGKRVVLLLLGAFVSLLLVLQILSESYGLADDPLKFKPVGLPTEVVREPRHSVRRCDDGDTAARKSLWTEPNSRYCQCVRPSEDEKRTVQSTTDGYLMFHANGGLNQMRTAICDMVAVARVLNATLVVPDLDHDSYWNDSSNFEDIFDVQHFIQHLEHDVRIVRTLPDQYNFSQAYKLAPKSWSDIDYYKTEILPLLSKHKVLYFTFTDSRLANNGVPDEIQRLRCRTNYQALQFSQPIRSLAQRIIGRLGQGSYIALHLRYERDMLAFTGCTDGLTDVEVEELKQLRYSTSRWKEKEINATSKRAAGGCPLTPYETQLFLKAMGYPANTIVYVAGGPIYGGEKRLGGFTSYYKKAVSKDIVASKSELRELSKYQNRLAALDYMVAVQSNVFVPSFDGNMARMVEGHRRFEGHRKTLLPDRAQLVKDFDDYAKGTNWTTVELEVQRAHRDRQGQPHYRVPLPPSQAKVEENFYANPLPGCICEVARTS